jgi:multiple sugar transport system substrate-binding protein
MSQIAAGVAPDLMLVGDDQIPAFSLKGVFLDLKPYLEKDPSVKLEDYFPGILDRYTVNGALLCLPRNLAPIAVIYYNKKEFDEAGLPYPKDDWDYQEFLETAKKLTKKDSKGKTVQYGFIDQWANAQVWGFAFGGREVDDYQKPTRCALDSPENIAGSQFRVDLSMKYGVAPDPAVLKEMGGLGTTDLFMNGTAAMFFSGTWTIPVFRDIKGFDWDVVEFPKGPGGHRDFPLHNMGFGVWKGSKHPELAYELAKAMAGESGQKFMAASGLVMPALRSVAQSPAFLDDQKPKSKGFLIEALRYGHYAPFDPNYQEWTDMAGSAFDRVWSGKDTTEHVLKEVTKKINAKFYGKK